MKQLTAKSTNVMKSPNNSGTSSVASGAIARVEELGSESEVRWADKLRVNESFTRAMVSLQANKGEAVYRWFKHKEAFSAALVLHFLSP